ncbi:MAG TPA: Dabb family protein [Acidimicrobiales bacterium]|nr:Dabb family protein [Acidimicrobiales bacterium]
MIRHAVMVKLRDDADADHIARLLDGFRSLRCPGTLAYSVGTDAGLREGNWSFLVVADFTDAEAFRGYDADEEHNRLRGELAPYVEQMARCQFEL